MLSIALIAGIAIRFSGGVRGNDDLILNGEPNTSPIIDIDTEAPKIDINTGEVNAPRPNGDGEGDDQAIQAEPEAKPTPPPTPTAEEIDSGSIPIAEPGEKVATPTPVATEPPAFNGQGQMYVTGFGYVDGGGDSQIIEVEGMVPNGNQIGQMG